MGRGGRRRDEIQQKQKKSVKGAGFQAKGKSKSGRGEIT